jgi:hypothetical protein
LLVVSFAKRKAGAEAVNLQGMKGRFEHAFESSTQCDPAHYSYGCLPGSQFGKVSAPPSPFHELNLLLTRVFEKDGTDLLVVTCFAHTECTCANR